MSYELDDPAMVLAAGFAPALATHSTSLAAACKRLLVGLREQNEMEPPAGDAPAGILYKRNPQAAAWRRAKLNFGSLLNASPSKDKATGLQNNDGCDVVFPS